MLLVPRDWWLEDISDLDIDLYKRVIQAIKSKSAPPDLIAESIRIYTYKSLPDVINQEPNIPMRENALITSEEAASSCKLNTEMTAKDRNVLETVVSLLPSEKGTSSCSFLLRLLKACTFLDASSCTKMDLARRVGLQLDEASLHDLMIPSVSYASDTVCDVDLMARILEHYMMQFRSGSEESEVVSGGIEVQRTTLLNEIARDSHVVEHRMTAATHGSQLKVAKLVDRYLAEVAKDANMPLGKFIQLAESVPDFARPLHDGLYRAIDMYLKVCSSPEFTLSNIMLTERENIKKQRWDELVSTSIPGGRFFCCCFNRSLHW